MLPVPPAPAPPPPGAAAASLPPAPAPASAALTPAALTPAIELELAPEEAARLPRHPALADYRGGRPKSTAVNIVWYDTPSGGLAAQALCLSGQGGHWRLEKLHPDAEPWLPATPPPLLASAESIEALARVAAQDGAPVPVAAFAGRRKDIPLLHGGHPACLSILEGSLRGVLHDRAVCRLTLCGEPRAMAALAAGLSAHVPVQPPLASLAAEALAVAKAAPPVPRRLGAPTVPPHASLGEALRLVTAHLADVILYWGARIGDPGTAEPVHQMRVAVRRYRSALAVFRRALPPESAWLHDLAAELKALAALLGTARDWDVFLQTTAVEVRQAFPDDRRIAAMVAAAGRRQSAAYAALRHFLGGSDAWRRQRMTLALLPSLQPWEGEAAGQAADYAGSALDRRLRHVLQPGATLEGLPTETLHDIRKHAKRLRYAIEFFSPFYPEKPVRRYLARLEALQEDFGTLNDTAVAGSLVASLGNPFAAGAVQGFGAARVLRARKKLQRLWTKFCRETPFWE